MSAKDPPGPGKHRHLLGPELEIEVDHATAEEAEAVIKAMEQILREEREAARPSAWKTTGRAVGTRNGIIDYRGPLGERAWRLAGQLSWTGQPYNGRHGRGDAK